MFSYFLKRVLPFTLTFIVGAALGGFAGLFKSRNVEEVRWSSVTHDLGHGCKGKRERYWRKHSTRAFGSRARTNIVATQSYPRDNAMYERGSDWQPVNILSSPDPDYTRRARRNGTHGVVRFNVIFGADGKTEIEEVVSTAPDGLTEEAMEAVRAIEFTPATLRGERVSTHGVVDCIFELEPGKRL